MTHLFNNPIGSSSSSLNEGVWLSEVELLTYAPPTRRLWMGPQFAFKPFSEKQDRSDSERDDPISPTPVLPAIHDISELMGVSHLDLKSLHTSPLSMNCLSSVGGKEEPIPGSDPDSINTGEMYYSVCVCVCVSVFVCASNSTCIIYHANHFCCVYVCHFFCRCRSIWFLERHSSQIKK